MHRFVPRQAGRPHLLGDEPSGGFGRGEQREPPVFAVSKNATLFAVLVEGFAYRVIRCIVRDDVEQRRRFVDGFASHPGSRWGKRARDLVRVAKNRMAEQQIVRAGEHNARVEQDGVDLAGAADHPARRILALLSRDPRGHLRRGEVETMSLGIIGIEFHSRVTARASRHQDDATLGLLPRVHRCRARGAEITARIPRCAPGCIRTRGRRPRGRPARCGCH